MKRSEMIDKLSDKIFTVDYKSSKDIAQTVLEFLEDQGMLPPPRVFTYEEYKEIERYNSTPHTSVHSWNKE